MIVALYERTANRHPEGNLSTYLDHVNWARIVSRSTSHRISCIIFQNKSRLARQKISSALITIVPPASPYSHP